MKPKFVKLVIPSTATLKDIIFLINGFCFEIDVNDKNCSEWIYDHKDWVTEETDYA